MHGFLMATLLTMAMSARTDTTLSVTPGTQFELENYAGSIEVTTWARNAVRIEASHGRRAMLDISRDEGSIQVDIESTHGVPTSAEFQLTVPAWMGLKLSGVYCDISISGSKGPLEVETVQGDVEVTGGSGHVSLQSVQGTVSLRGASGKVEVSSVNEGVEVTDVSGELTAESVNGAITVRNARVSSFEASTINGTLSYDGSFERGGHYEMSTHNGSIYVAIPANADLALEASSYSGSFEATFPIEKDREHARRKHYTVRFGAGSAEMSLESFQGSIVLHRPGERVSGDEADEDTGSKVKAKAKSKSKSGAKDADPDSDEP